MRLTLHISMMTIRGESSCLLLLHDIQTLCCQSIKVTRTRWTLKFFMLSPSSFPHPLCLPLSTSKMLTCGEVRNCQRRKMKCTCASHFVRMGLHCLSQELYTISPEPPGGRLFIGDECLLENRVNSYECRWCAILYVRRKRSAREPLTLDGI